MLALYVAWTGMRGSGELQLPSLVSDKALELPLSQKA
ncbi:hypothetical protein NX02_02675 [Sphingomonas sanxanigenens DSM 19645 = NX02]|uniref:Uncharacterized protein n=1 Tax=Sphingomonas sanxanigenens DSM 19645 = NX02 TaxID=1123269 RepID=W0A7I1_9SPHN|nr:hypothetical protein NX02_02675 [Sphingomonas sanxanigenens DSM 19645 = NX02]